MGKQKGQQTARGAEGHWGTLRSEPFPWPHLPSLRSFPKLLPLRGCQEFLQGHKSVLVGVHLGSQTKVSECAEPAAPRPRSVASLTFFITCSRMRSRSSSISLMSSSSFFGSYTFSSCRVKGEGRSAERVGTHREDTHLSEDPWGLLYCLQPLCR